MPNILEKKLNKNENHLDNSAEDTLENKETLNGSETNQEPTGNKPQGIITTIGSLLPFAPMLFEQWTGQKIPAITGTIAEIQQSISQLVLAQSQFNQHLAKVLSNQEQIFQRIVNLEKTASQQILSLDRRIESLASIKLTHECERKQVEYQAKPALIEDKLAEEYQ